MNLDVFALALANIISPPVLAFALGLLAVAIKSDLRLPEAFYQAISIYLLLGIGIKGGAQKGASGSAVVNLAGELVGQIATGGYPATAEKTRVLPQKYGLYATELWVDMLETTPAPYSSYSGIPVSAQVSDGAPSNYIKEMINLWAPGELP